MNRSRFAAAVLVVAALSTCGPAAAAHAAEPARQGPNPPAATPADRSPSAAGEWDYRRGYAAGKAAGIWDAKHCSGGASSISWDASPYEKGYAQGYSDGFNRGWQSRCAARPRTVLTTSRAAGAVALPTLALDKEPIRSAAYEKGYAAGYRAGLAAMKGQRGYRCQIVHDAWGPDTSAYQRGYYQGWNDGVSAGERLYCNSR